MTAPTRTVSTTPPATMLSKKFLRDGEIPGCAASATSGITMAAVRAKAVNPVTAFSLSDAWTWILPLDFDDPDFAIEGSFMGLKKLSEVTGLLWAAGVNGRAMETAKEEAISCSSFQVKWRSTSIS
eukprot:TRINITY_DN4511_c0_g1_i1.p1 TRINITY_DN4511_c0_g1~~TRINITY_DN4511_c0_g1_i1.p1  ORF type:complete len:126 (-),score=17.08 TRINITY_DN4511_c0_g1_i1:87-464(-)